MTQDFCLIRACLQFIAEMAQALVELKPQINAALNYSLNQVNSDRLRQLAINAVMQICEYSNALFTEQEIVLLFNFLNQSYEFLNIEHASKLVKACGIIASM